MSSGPRDCLYDVAIQSIEHVIETGDVRAVYQPIVELDSGRTVAYEALIRGPRGSDLELPDRLFAAAAVRGLTAELDWVCREAALNGALRSAIGRSQRLFINVEPSTFRRRTPVELTKLFERAARELDVVVEITERALIGDPAALIAELSEMRKLGVGVAVDDLGADPASLALLPFVEPDVIKLDLRLVQRHTDSAVASISSAVRADAERRGSIIVAEGIETDEHRRRALVLGARLGQGWLFGHAADLPDGRPKQSSRSPTNMLSTPIATTPWSLVSDWADRRRTTKQLLLPMSFYIEQRALGADSCVLLSAFQNARNYSPATMRRYERLAVGRSMVGAIGVGINSFPSPCVRGGSVPEGHPLSREWTVTVVGPHDAVALIGRELDFCGDERDREFEYVITHDRPTVVAAARSLMQYLRAH